jgi:hypothetical protein
MNSFASRNFTHDWIEFSFDIVVCDGDSTNDADSKVHDA